MSFFFFESAANVFVSLLWFSRASSVNALSLYNDLELSIFVLDEARVVGTPLVYGEDRRVSVFHLGPPVALV
ncbi:hypothetical protein GGR56DRAFT_661778 [Xylariaceae sp. FL0804]|nr:hypothetical protein GGR56DRAFT_661778 [Xylariaceae sp. FL0804]